jgi:putative transposase
LQVSERRACAALGQHRSTQRKVPRGREDTERLSADVVELARQYGRYGYRKIAALLRQAGWSVSDGRVERIWRREGLKVPRKQPKRGRLWLTDGSCIRLRPERPNHVWSYDFVEDRTHDGRRYRMLNVIDEFTHECLAICINRKLKAIDVIDVLSDLFILRGVPGHIRSDNGAEFVAKAVREWIAAVGAKTAYIEPGSPWETATSKALMLVSGTNCSTTHCERPGSSSEVGADTTTPSALMPRSSTSHQHRRCLCRHLPRGRLRYVDRLRRPRWPFRKR